MTVRMRPLLVGTATYMPGMRRLTARRTGGTVAARYCYAVWMRHLVKAHAHGRGGHFPAVAELGPGDSLGLGLTALLSGMGDTTRSMSCATRTAPGISRCWRA